MSDPPAPQSARRREILVALGCLVVMAAAGIAISVVSSSGSSTSSSRATHRASSSSADVTTTRHADAIRQHAIHRLLAKRSAAIVHHHRAAFAATLDPASRRFRADQLQMFANLRRVHFASWSYTFGATGRRPPPPLGHRYHAPTWSPDGFSLHYRIAGFDLHPTQLPQYPTFVNRAGRWYLGSLSDFRGLGDTSATDLWDYAPVHVVRRPGVLALGPKSELGTMISTADVMQAAIPHVTAVWGHDWAQRVVVLVPATQHEMALVDADTGDLNRIAALTSAEVSTDRGRPSPVGDRVTINPRNWGKVGNLGAQIVLTHELTHVATRADTGSQTPKWLSEGFADYVGFLASGVPVTLAAAELATDVRAGKFRARLPTNRDFRGSNTALAQAYESGWLACRYLAGRYGQVKLVRFYRSVGTSQRGRSAAVAHSLHTVFGLTMHRFVADWHRYVEQQLA